MSDERDDTPAPQIVRVVDDDVRPPQSSGDSRPKHRAIRQRQREDAERASQECAIRARRTFAR